MSELSKQIGLGVYDETLKWHNLNQVSLSKHELATNHAVYEALRRRSKALGLEKITSAHWNTLFFDDFGPNQAYMVGFLAADGCLTKSNGSKNISIYLQNSDREFLEGIRTVLGVSQNLKTYHDANDYTKRQDKVYLNLRSDHAFDKLMEYGLTERKSKNLQVNIPDENELFWHFLRGLTDGDGSVHLHRSNEYTSIVWSFVTHEANQGFVQNLVSRLEGFGLVPKVEMPSKNPMWNLRFHNFKALDLLLNLYKQPDSIRLNRKFNNFLEWLRIKLTAECHVKHQRVKFGMPLYQYLQENAPHILELVK